MASDEDGPYHYLRIGRHETNQFPHGLALADKCRTKEDVSDTLFAKLVDEYIEIAFINPATKPEDVMQNSQSFLKEEWLSKHCRVYTVPDSEGSNYFIRIGGLKTSQFPLGLELATRCKSMEEAQGFAKLIDEYIELSFIGC